MYTKWRVHYEAEGGWSTVESYRWEWVARIAAWWLRLLGYEPEILRW